MEKLLKTEQKNIIRPEWDKMQDFLNKPLFPPLNAVKVIFADSKYNYTTDLSSQSTEQSAREYFVGEFFEMGSYPHENQQQCIDIEFINNQPTNNKGAY